jgi:tetratricopeptide (TPR) repeat protein
VPRGAPPQGASLAEIASMDRYIAGHAAQNANWAQAVEALSEAREMEPENADTSRALSDALVRVGRAPEAIQLLDDLLKAQPNDGAAHYFRAVLATQTGDLDTAFKHLRASLTWGAATPQKIALDERLKSLRTDPRFEALLDQQKGSQPGASGP